MSPERALRLALERWAGGELGVMLSVTGVETRTELAGTLAADLPDPALILLLDGPGDVPGALVLDPQLSAALVEAQTMGRVSPRPAPPRAPTRTDAAMAAPMVAGVFARLADMPAEAGQWVQGYRYGAMVEDARALSLALGTGDYRVMRLGCDLGPDRAGELVLALPAPRPSADPDAAGDAEPGAAARPALRDSLLAAPARLDAVLCRVSVPLSQMHGLRPGEVLALPAGVLNAARLEAVPGRAVARATLGQIRGQRALRLHGTGQGAVTPGGEGMGEATARPPVPDTPVAPPVPARIDPAAGLPDLSEFGPPEDAAGDDPPAAGAVPG